MLSCQGDGLDENKEIIYGEMYLFWIYLDMWLSLLRENIQYRKNNMLNLWCQQSDIVFNLTPPPGSEHSTIPWTTTEFSLLILIKEAMFKRILIISG